MATLVTDPSLAEELIEQRRATGTDRWDEVWEDTYIMAPLPNIEHQALVAQLAAILVEVVVNADRGHVFAGVNVTDQPLEWTKNYRCPDVAVYLKGNPAENRDTHWLGGPDFLIEVVSPDDRSREKLEFYAKVASRELLLIDRDPWSLELYRLADGELKLVGTSDAVASTLLSSEIVPLAFRLIDGLKRPRIEVSRTDGDGVWRI